MNDVLNYFVFFVLLTLAAWPLGRWVARVFEAGPEGVLKAFRPVEHGLIRLTGVKPGDEMDWKQWVGALMMLSAVKIAVVFLLLFFQDKVPFQSLINPQNFPGVPWDLALNTAVSFVTNTNWQNYGGEATMSYFSQMAVLGVQNFLSAAAGIAVMAALIRGIFRRETKALGNFWVDMVRINLYLLLPISLVYSLLLTAQGAIQNFSPYLNFTTLAGAKEVLPLGPVASQEAIKMLGTNGGGFFNANSAHPFENPTAFTNFVQAFSVFLLPASFVFAYGRIVKDKRQSWAIYGVMIALFTCFAIPAYLSELAPPAHAVAGIDWSAGNLEGKETRFGVGPSVLFNLVTTATSCGAVDAMNDSFTPIGGMMPLLLIQVGEVVFGGVGSGLYGMLAVVLLTVFVGGLMVGRTPEYLGKKIDGFDMKMIVAAVTITPFLILVGTAAATLWHWVPSDMSNPVPHGFTEIFYALSSMANNNGSAFAGLNGNTHFWNVTGAVTMFFGRFGVMVPILALAGHLAGKKVSAASLGTLPTHGVTFSVLLVFFVFLVAALNFIPGLALGPIAEALQ
ncbi:MAG: potassium-transporting ATPase subunit KdpA [Spirochaetales bacterium]|nr:potassium-transporting ATPase subunit KdpA [Spirochaetales bacterium]